MSDAGPPAIPDPSPIPAPPGPPPEPRHGCLTAFMVIAGLIMLLPGICALTFGLGTMTHPDPMISLLVLLGLAIGAGGIFLIRAAVRGPRP